jgi:hypothetical protein
MEQRRSPLSFLFRHPCDRGFERDDAVVTWTPQCGANRLRVDEVDPVVGAARSDGCQGRTCTRAV